MVRALGGKIGKLDNNNHDSQENYVHLISIKIVVLLQKYLIKKN